MFRLRETLHYGKEYLIKAKEYLPSISLGSPHIKATLFFTTLCALPSQAAAKVGFTLDGQNYIFNCLHGNDETHLFQKIKEACNPIVLLNQIPQMPNIKDYCPGLFLGDRCFVGMESVANACVDNTLKMACGNQHQFGSTEDYILSGGIIIGGLALLCTGIYVGKKLLCKRQVEVDEDEEKTEYKPPLPSQQILDLQIDYNDIPYELRCVVELNVMNDPVAISCNHVFDRKYAETVKTCPLCREVPQMFENAEGKLERIITPRPQVAAAIQEFIQEERFKKKLQTNGLTRPVTDPTQNGLELDGITIHAQKGPEGDRFRLLPAANGQPGDQAAPTVNLGNTYTIG